MAMIRGVALFALLAGASAQTPNYAMEWERFKGAHKKAVLEATDEARRFEIFKSNVDIIYEWNAKNLSFELGVNEFADQSPEEFTASHLGFKKNENVWGEVPRLGTHVYSGAPLAKSVDWVSKGAVTPVKNQGQCGSCWAFSTTGSLEGAWQLATGQLVAMSEQQFVDCDHVDQGCGGGLMDNAFQFAQKKAICTEKSYSYKGRAGSCEASSCKVAIPKHGVTGFKDVAQDSMKALMEAVSQQPVSIAIEADRSVFQLYKGGVVTGDCGSHVDHGVLAVGYGTLKGQDYWKVKNSWGPAWGMDGYVNVARGIGGESGECALLSQPSYPVVKGKALHGPSRTPDYEEPPCHFDEVQASVQGAGGSVCAPPCDGMTCPTNVPPGTTAQPECILQDASSGQKYCALQCNSQSSCPTGGKCAMIGGTIGVCVYPTSNGEKDRPLVLATDESVPINI